MTSIALAFLSTKLKLSLVRAPPWGLFLTVPNSAYQIPTAGSQRSMRRLRPPSEGSGWRAGCWWCWWDMPLSFVWYGGEFYAYLALCVGS